MIPVKDLLYKIDMKLNKKVSSEHQNIPLEDKILALNEAQIKLIKRKISTNNNYNLGLDSFKKRYEDLQVLVETFEQLSVVNTSNGAYSSFSGNLNLLKEKYMLPLDLFALCTKGQCSGRPLYISKIIKHGDLSTYMGNKNYIPSFEYQESIAVISDNKITVYTDGTFNVDNISLSYIRYPQLIDYEGYIKFDGTPSTTQDSELPDYLADELLDLTVLELAMETENTPQVEFGALKNKINE
jgi:hypothetical protein